MSTSKLTLSLPSLEIGTGVKRIWGVKEPTAVILQVLTPAEEEGEAGGLQASKPLRTLTQLQGSGWCASVRNVGLGKRD
jgi:hypothetical protein